MILQLDNIEAILLIWKESKAIMIIDNEIKSKPQEDC